MANESDTVLLTTDLLAYFFGYDKYSEITSEHAIRGTYCDLAIKIEGELRLLIEVKAIGLELKEAHVKQVVDYAANQGVEWVVLTNAITWRVYRIHFGKPIDNELVIQFDLLEMNPRVAGHLENLYLLTREGILKDSLALYYAQRQATNRFFLGALLLSDPVLDVLRRELRRLAPDVRIDNAEIKAALTSEVLKREVVEGEKAEEARKKVQRAAGKALRVQKSKQGKSKSGFLVEEPHKQSLSVEKSMADTSEEID
jgi:Type I restriction enzyme R protein N terminus (HSDR_N)